MTTQTDETSPDRAERLRKAREAFYEAAAVFETGTVGHLDDAVHAYAACLAGDAEGLAARLLDPGFRNEFQHLRPWSELDAIHSEAAEALRASEVQKATLAAEIEKLRLENAKLAAIAEGRIGEARLLRAGPDGKGGFTFDLAGGPVQFIAEYLAQLLGKNEDSGLRNYAEIEVQNREIGAMTLTLQRKAGKTPHQFRLEAEAHAAELQDRLDELHAMAAICRWTAACSPEVESEIVEAACKGYWPLHWPKHFDPKDAESIRSHMRSAFQAGLDRFFATWDKLTEEGTPSAAAVMAPGQDYDPA